MDRQTALERLDAVRRGSDDFSEAEMAGLRDSLRRDGLLRAEFDRRREWDRRIGTAIQDVSIPSGLKDRVLSRLADVEAASPPRPASISRRRMFASLAALAAGLVATIAYWTVTGSVTPVAVAEVRDAAADLLNPRTEEVPFSGDFSPQLPEPTWQSRLAIATQPFGLLKEGNEHRAVAWRVRSRDRAHRQAVLAAIPIGHVTAPPEANSISDRDYVPGGKMSGVRSVRWAKDGFVYVFVCGADDLDSFIAELENTRLA